MSDRIDVVGRLWIEAGLRAQESDAQRLRHVRGAARQRRSPRKRPRAGFGGGGTSGRSEATSWSTGYTGPVDARQVSPHFRRADALVPVAREQHRRLLTASRYVMTPHERGSILGSLLGIVICGGIGGLAAWGIVTLAGLNGTLGAIVAAVIGMFVATARGRRALGPRPAAPRRHERTARRCGDRDSPDHGLRRATTDRPDHGR